MKSTVHDGSFIIQKETFHKTVCQSKLLYIGWLFEASIHFPHREMKDKCVSAQDVSVWCSVFCLNVSVEGNV